MSRPGRRHRVNRIAEEAAREQKPSTPPRLIFSSASSARTLRAHDNHDAPLARQLINSLVLSLSKGVSAKLGAGAGRPVETPFDFAEDERGKRRIECILITIQTSLGRPRSQTLRQSIVNRVQRVCHPNVVGVTHLSRIVSLRVAHSEAFHFSVKPTQVCFHTKIPITLQGCLIGPKPPLFGHVSSQVEIVGSTANLNDVHVRTWTCRRLIGRQCQGQNKHENAPSFECLKRDIIMLLPRILQLLPPQLP
jgi:hypothetical protein